MTEYSSYRSNIRSIHLIGALLNLTNVGLCNFILFIFQLPNNYFLTNQLVYLNLPFQTTSVRSTM
ncbi:unnamed protein product [Heterobilharzia americana]|nr:unnamed protein product [Heterobilharzia americana]CAH8640836.1 unnamed protein product [Heterobilharzia americana]